VFKLHRQVLMEKSPFFQKCLTSGMIEEHTNKVILPEDSPRAFDLVAEWVYSAKLLLPRPGWKYDSITMMGAWVLADKYCIPHLQNAVIDSLAGYWSVNWMNPDHLSWAADHTDNESPLYRLALDEMAHDLHYYNNLYPESNIYRPPEINEDYSEALERVVPRPFLSNRLLFETLGPFHEDDPPAESPQNYHVPTKLLIGGTTSTNATKRKREADDNTEEPAVASKVTRQS